MNLEELLVDICLLLGAPAYVNKVYGVCWKIAHDPSLCTQVVTCLWFINKGTHQVRTRHPVQTFSIKATRCSQGVGGGVGGGGLSQNFIGDAGGGWLCAKYPPPSPLRFQICTGCLVCTWYALLINVLTCLFPFCYLELFLGLAWCKNSSYSLYVDPRNAHC
jgi:hypothetical protein